jgi:hypothetical protein
MPDASIFEFQSPTNRSKNLCSGWGCGISGISCAKAKLAQAIVIAKTVNKKRFMIRFLFVNNDQCHPERGSPTEGSGLHHQQDL